MANENKIELAQMIKGLRQELTTAQNDAGGEDLRFAVDDIEIELEVVAEVGKSDAKGDKVGVKFFAIFSTEVAGNETSSDKNLVRNKVKLKLKPYKEVLDKETGEKRKKPVDISG